MHRSSDAVIGESDRRGTGSKRVKFVGVVVGVVVVVVVVPSSAKVKWASSGVPSIWPPPSDVARLIRGDLQGDESCMDATATAMKEAMATAGGG